MYISDLKLVNFRNYDSERVEFSKGTNILVGANAQGKTNLLESVYFCSKGSSFKTTSDKTIIQKGQAYFSLDAQIIKSNRRKLIHIRVGEDKVIKINDVLIDRVEDFKNQFELVYFLPDHLRIVKDGPSLRRELVDEAIINIRPAFKGLLTSYNRILGQRNARLKEKTRYFKEELAALTHQLSVTGSKIILIRRDYIKTLNKKAKEIHSFITGQKEDIALKYSTSLKETDNESSLARELRHILDKSLEIDIQRGFTTRGPHRDDLSIYINKMNIKKYGSQGQQRSAILSIKLAEIEIIKHTSGYSPILLLDDVFSELDKDRRSRLMEIISNVQALITTNDIDFDITKNMTLYTVKEGRILK